MISLRLGRLPTLMVFSLLAVFVAACARPTPPPTLTVTSVVATSQSSLEVRFSDAVGAAASDVTNYAISGSDGSTLAEQAGRTMGEMVASVQRVTDIMAEISAASQEQASGIEQVNQTITQMDETTQQNAALVEEASAAARSMEEQAGQLSGAVAMFRLLEDREAPDEPKAARRQPSSTAGAGRRNPARKPRRPEPALSGADWQEF